MNLFTETKLIEKTFPDGSERVSIELKVYAVQSVEDKKWDGVHSSAKMHPISSQEIASATGRQSGNAIREFYRGEISWEEMTDKLVDRVYRELGQSSSGMAR